MRRVGFEFCGMQEQITYYIKHAQMSSVFNYMSPLTIRVLIYII